ncbi:hypothetical protein CQW23_06944 [Capsicum baccatum]|uniref:Uncharacterized protein n=1 Tax=Capsicum baccatum TaxID=33114 RepID=A0A2G2X4S1_CAPBA|nr:hypothetical protein CQW23_06944 [Capsicum baccatum]
MAAQESNSNVIDSCQSSEEDTALINTLPSAMFWDVMGIKKWQGFWFEPGLIKPAMKFCSYFQVRNDDVLLASAPKTGYWLESQKRPEKILFLKYEETIKDPKEKGMVGDRKNHLNTEMEDSINQTTLLKFQGSGLELEN